MDLWTFAAEDEKLDQGFNEAMAADARLLVQECNHVFDGLKTMMDVTGGTGPFLVSCLVETCLKDGDLTIYYY